MALQGNLEHLGLADLLQTGLHGHANGTLTLRRGAERAVLFLSDGGLHVLEPEVAEAEEVLAALVRRGRLDANVLGRSRRKDRRGTALLDHLVEEGFLQSLDVMEVLATVAEDIITDLVAWQQGEFRFDEGPMDPRKVGLVGRAAVDTAGVLLRAARRMDESALISSQLGWYPTLFVGVAGEPPAAEDDADVTPAVYAHLDGRTSITEVALSVGISRIDVLRSVLQLVRSGAARPATPQEITQLLHEAREVRHLMLSRSLLLQWSEQVPNDPEPYKRLATLARDHGQLDHEVDALRALAQLYLGQGAHSEAVSVLLDALARSPSDELVKEELRYAAEQAGDDQSFAYGTRLLAEAALQREDANRALDLVDPLCLSAPHDMELRLLKARALVQLGRRDELAREGELVAGLLGGTGRRRRDREIAAWFRDAVAHMCPERGDLLRKFRSMNESPGHRVRRVALLGALIAVVAGAGIVLWPTSSSNLLDQARVAMQQGRSLDAQQLLTQIIQQHSDSVEVEEAYQMQAALSGPPAAATARPRVDTGIKARVEELSGAAYASIANFPNVETLSTLKQLAALLESSRGTPLRAPTLSKLGPVLAEWTTNRVRIDRLNLDLLAQAADAPRTMRQDSGALRTFLSRCDELPDDKTLEQYREGIEVLQRFSRLMAGTDPLPNLRDLESLQSALARQLRGHSDALLACKVLLRRLEIDAAEAASREEAPRLLVAGELEQADRIYDRLQQLLLSLEGRAGYEDLLEDVRRRQLPDLVRERRGIVTAVRAGLASAKAAEESGDLGAAARAYATLMKKYWAIRLENIFSVPLRILVTPAGASVLLNGQPAGTAPLIVRYPWNGQTTIQVQAEGYEPVTHLVIPNEAQPIWQVDLSMRPKVLWEIPQAGRLHASPTGLGGDVLAVERNGRVSLYRRTDGSVRWGRHYQSLEGVRAQSTMDETRIYIAQVDGTLLILDRETGSRRAEYRGARPTGGCKVLSGWAAICTQEGTVQLFAETSAPVTVPLGEKANVGVVAAHDRFWIGTASGRLVSVQPTTRQVDSRAVSHKNFPVVGLVAHADGLVAVAADGTLVNYDRRGVERWRKEAVGEVVGDPAVCNDRVGICDRRGRILMFSLDAGEARGAIELGVEPVGGLRAAGSVMIAALTDGRLWIQDPDRDRPLCLAPLGSIAAFGPEVLDAQDLLLHTTAGGLMLMRLPLPR